MKTYMFINLVVFYISLGFMLKKAGYNEYLSFIPFLNLYYLSKVIKTNIIFFIILIIAAIFLPIKNLILTILYFYMPFILGYYYYGDYKIQAITLIIPFFGYPFMALRGKYNG